MENIFEVTGPQGKKTTIDNTPTVECIDVNDSMRKAYIEAHVVATIVTPLGSCIEIAENKKGFIVAIHSEYASSEYITTDLLNALRQLHKATDMNRAIVVSNDIYFAERLVDISIPPHESPLSIPMPSLSVKGFSVSYNNTDNN